MKLKTNNKLVFYGTFKYITFFLRMSKFLVTTQTSSKIY